MSGLMRLLAALLFGVFFAASGHALACTCAGDFEEAPPKGKDQAKHKDLSARRLEKAKIVVRGKVLTVHAGVDVYFPSSSNPMAGTGSATFTSSRAVVADFLVDSAVKGTVSGQVKLYTGFGVGDCGIAGLLLAATAWDRPVSIELTPIPKVADSFTINMCGYGELHEKK